MGLEVINKKIQVGKNELDGSDDFLNISNFIIPFSIMFRNNTSPDIYSGEESIFFRERDSNFQEILLSEFLL